MVTVFRKVVALEFEVPKTLGAASKHCLCWRMGSTAVMARWGKAVAMFGRQAYVGLVKDGIGSLTLGRQYSLSTDILGAGYTMGSQTPAGNYAYHINDLDQLVQSRLNNAVKFSSANFAGLTFGGMYAFSNSTNFSGAPTTTAGTTATQGSSSAYSFGANYTNGPFGIGAAYTNIRYPNGATPPFGVSVANVNTGGLRDLETFGIGTRYAIGAGLAWANWTRTKLEPLAGRSSTLNNYEIGGRYLFTAALNVGLGYTFSDLGDRFEGKWHQINGAVDYALSKRTDIYLLAVYQKASGSNSVAGRSVQVQAEIGSAPSFIGNAGANSQLVTRVGLRHKF